MELDEKLLLLASNCKAFTYSQFTSIKERLGLSATLEDLIQNDYVKKIPAEKYKFRFFHEYFPDITEFYIIKRKLSSDLYANFNVTRLSIKDIPIENKLTPQITRNLIKTFIYLQFYEDDPIVNQSVIDHLLFPLPLIKTKEFPDDKVIAIVGKMLFFLDADDETIKQVKEHTNALATVFINKELMSSYKSLQADYVSYYSNGLIKLVKNIKEGLHE
ncbi:MAG: hypothetical protein QXJ93_02665 [Candidatus Rehaiarchaeum fermentans]|nr:hypothetical protein [Candidatus Rehaiarchaeum fermentans]